jgi:hypothetical protein
MEVVILLLSFKESIVGHCENRLSNDIENKKIKNKKCILL